MKQKRKNNFSSSILVRLVEEVVEEIVPKALVSLSEQIREPFFMELPGDLKQLAQIFHDSGYQLYVVGGAVRDAILGKEPKDYDVATDANPDEVLALLAPYPQYKKLEVGKAFGVINVITPENNEYEVATFRVDVGKGRRPDAVEFSTIEQDVKRRDLTINALFYDISAGEVVDFVGGIEDIRNGVVKAVGSAKERFDEDRLRILRAIRFAARMGSELDPETETAILEDNSLQGVSPERVRDEFLKSIKSAQSVQGLLSMYDKFGLWDQIMNGLNVNRVYPNTNNIPVLLALLLRDNKTNVITKKLNALKYNITEVRQIAFLNMIQDLKPETAYKFKKLWRTTQLHEKDLEEFASLNAGKPPIRLVKAFNKYEPSVKGEDLLDQGFKGRELGQELERQETELFTKLL